MIVLDATVLIAHLDADDIHHAAATSFLGDNAHEGFGASVITLAEVFVGPVRSGRLEIAQTAIDRLGVQPVPLDAEAAVKLATLRAETGLRIPDCCVVLAAQRTGGTLKTFDKRLASTAEQLKLA